ncbi:MAG: fumarate hydratase [Saccharofermentanales bacterium]|jgi:fumarate hydratase subunit alpha|nr:fumarate hydratase [Bacillota bacterium]
MSRITEIVRETLITAGSTFSEGKKQIFREAIANETNENARWALKAILENAEVAEKNKSPLCDDTGIPHLFIEIGRKRALTGEMLDSIYLGVEQGLRILPGRPMNILGNDMQKIDQSGGLDPDPASVMAAPLMIRLVDEDIIRLHILLLGGGPAIRGKTYRIYHKHSLETIRNEIVTWSNEAVKLLGCTPCTLAIGIGRSHYEAAFLMMEAQVYGRYDIQSSFERQITNDVNESHIGTLGLGGDVSVLATFLRVGPQRASGVRIVSLCPCCSVEPRVASVDL